MHDDVYFENPRRGEVRSGRKWGGVYGNPSWAYAANVIAISEFFFLIAHLCFRSLLLWSGLIQYENMTYVAFMFPTLLHRSFLFMRQQFYPHLRSTATQTNWQKASAGGFSRLCKAKACVNDPE